jgi:hypothetical protein
MSNTHGTPATIVMKTDFIQLMEQVAKKKLQNKELGNQELRVQRWSELLGEELREKLIIQAHNNIPAVIKEARKNRETHKKRNGAIYASGNKLTRAASTAT